DPAETATPGTQSVEAAGRTGGAPPEARRVWRELARFASYSFNKAHAASYAELSWRTAFVKAHRPAAFACGVLAHYGGHYPLRAVAADFARHGVRFLPPDVNASSIAHWFVDGGVRIGLAAVEGLV